MTQRRRRGQAPKKHRAVYLADATYAMACAMAERQGLSFTAWVEEMIHESYGGHLRDIDEDEEE